MQPMDVPQRARAQPAIRPVRALPAQRARVRGPEARGAACRRVAVGGFAARVGIGAGTAIAICACAARRAHCVRVGEPKYEIAKGMQVPFDSRGA
jgi:hypothetical protein